MKIFCCLCTEHCFDTTDVFKCGGPYNGSMFAKPNHVGPYKGQYPRQGEWQVGGDLTCPFCEQDFMLYGLVTEHGVIVPGQKTIDTSMSILNDDGSLKYRLMLSKEISAFVCENCGREFATEQGLKVHGYKCNKDKKDA
jgi:hypothetical protein